MEVFDINGQTAPANEEQQRRQQNANRPRMKM